MAKRDKTVHKKSRGRPAGIRYGETIPVRLETETTKAVDQWAKMQDVSRSEAIRRLVEHGLVSAQPNRPTNKKAAAKAAGMAGEMVEFLSDQSASVEVREKRKRRLLKGPSEFRDIRGDLPKAKPR